MRISSLFIGGFIPMSICAIVVDLRKKRKFRNYRESYHYRCYCVATIGVCVFRAPASVGALFIYIDGGFM